MRFGFPSVALASSILLGAPFSVNGEERSGCCGGGRPINTATSAASACTLTESRPVPCSCDICWPFSLSGLGSDGIGCRGACESTGWMGLCAPGGRRAYGCSCSRKDGAGRGSAYLGASKLWFDVFSLGGGTRRMGGGMGSARSR
jgi:hypothetical protein